MAAHRGQVFTFSTLLRAFDRQVLFFLCPGDASVRVRSSWGFLIIIFFFLFISTPQGEKKEKGRRLSLPCSLVNIFHPSVKNKNPVENNRPMRDQRPKAPKAFPLLFALHRAKSKAIPLLFFLWLHYPLPSTLAARQGKIKSRKKNRPMRDQRSKSKIKKGE